MRRNILLTIEYDGTEFFGWQRQPDVRTVQGEIEKVLSVICAQKIEINGVSRTDAGVHALDQKATFDADFAIPVTKLAEVANNLLDGGKKPARQPSDVRIIKAEEVPEGFHARFDSVGKNYRYLINNCPEPDIFMRNRCYHVQGRLDLAAMRKAAGCIVGTHDFACFQAAGGNERETTIRTVYDLSLKRAERGAADFGGAGTGDYIEMEITGDGFLYNMVRIITGTLVDVGLGKLAPSSVKEILENKDRTLAGHTAPARGLYLAKVYYDLEEMRGRK